MKLPRMPKRLRAHLWALVAESWRPPPGLRSRPAMTTAEWQTAERSVREFLRPR